MSRKSKINIYSSTWKHPSQVTLHAMHQFFAKQHEHMLYATHLHALQGTQHKSIIGCDMNKITASVYVVQQTGTSANCINLFPNLLCDRIEQYLVKRLVQVWNDIDIFLEKKSYGHVYFKHIYLSYMAFHGMVGRLHDNGVVCNLDAQTFKWFVSLLILWTQIKTLSEIIKSFEVVPWD